MRGVCVYVFVCGYMFVSYGVTLLKRASQLCSCLAMQGHLQYLLFDTKRPVDLVAR
jgi:hypothetical protein